MNMSSSTTVDLYGFHQIRRRYEEAFQQLTLDVQRLHQLTNSHIANQEDLAEAEKRLACAWDKYYETRNNLANALLNRKQSGPSWDKYEFSDDMRRRFPSRASGSYLALDSRQAVPCGMWE
jgi:hypothetical protein